MKIYKYNDGLLNGGRRPRLYLAKGGKVAKFEGENIPEFCAIVRFSHEKCGKWSNTDYTIALAPGVRALEFVSPLHGKWGDDLPSWGAVAEKLGLPIEVAQEIVRHEYKATAQRLDSLEEFAVSVEQQNCSTETVVVSFGSPTNRQIRDGYWSESKSAQTSDGRTVTIEPNPDWESPIAVVPVGAKVISSRHKPGMHGGYWTVEVAVPVPQN